MNLAFITGQMLSKESMNLVLVSSVWVLQSSGGFWQEIQNETKNRNTFPSFVVFRYTTLDRIKCETRNFNVKVGAGVRTCGKY